MILQRCCSLSLLRYEEAAKAHGEGAARGGKLLSESFWKEEQQLQEFRVSGSSAAFRTPPCCGFTFVVLFLRSVFRVPHVSVTGSFSFEQWVHLLQRRFDIFWRDLVSVSLHFGTRSPQLFLVTGNVTMEDEKSMHSSRPTQTTDPKNSLVSNTISNLEGKEAGQEYLPSDSSRVSPQEPVVGASPSVAERQVHEASPDGHENDGVAVVVGATLTGADEQDTLGVGKDLVAEPKALDEPGEGKELVAESTPSDGPGDQPISHVRTGGASAACNCSDQPKVENPESVDSQGRTHDEVKERTEPGNSSNTDSLKNGKPNRADSQNGGPIQSEPQVAGESLTSPAKSTLMAVLEKLVSLDPTEVFKDPVDDSFAPNYSKVIKTPMCFSMMQEKIGLQQYPSWSLFVEDFERICYNAMKYNQKRSRIWNAASTLLRQGKKVFEPYTEQGESMLGVSSAVEDAPKNAVEAAAKTHAPDASKDGIQNKVEDVVQDLARDASADAEKNVVQVVETGTADELGEEKSIASHQGGVLERDSVPKPDSELTKVVVAARLTELELQNSHGANNADSAIPGIISKDTMKDVAAVVVDPLVTKNDELPHDNNNPIGGTRMETRSKHVHEDVKVEILESTGSEDVRPDSRDEATECSSSFGYTQSKVDSDPEGDGFQQNAEVESELRDGNGALSSACAEEDELAGGNERGKKALNAEWKKYRRGIEWRCRWLEIRLNELSARSQRYVRLAQERRAKKAWVANVQPGEESSARSAQMVDSPERGSILRRQRRTQVENTVDLDLYMARHPLFSRYDKKRKRETEDAFAEAKAGILQHVENQQNLLVDQEKKVPDESDTEEQLVLGSSSLGGQDSMEKILWKVEALQARVEKAKAQLLRGAPLPKSVLQPLTIPKPPSNLSRGSLASPRITAPGTTPRPPGTKGRPPSGQSPGVSGTPTANGGYQRQVTGILRRKAADYDINNMVMPVSVGAKYVEHIKHADIWTPHWRLIDNAQTADQSMGGSSSDENTDDEQFEVRHSEMEINEKKQRYLLPPKRSPDGDFGGSGKGRSKSGMGKGAGKMSGRGSVPTKPIATPAAESPPDSSSSPALAASIPKGKRRKRLFNATGFTTNHAQRLTAYLAEASSSLQSPEGARESMLIEDTIETRSNEETSTESIVLPELEKPSVQPSHYADQADAKRKKSAASGLQVLANP